MPGTIIPKAVGSAGLTPLETPGRFDVSELVLDQLRERIRKALFVDQLGQVNGPRMTATEVLERSAEMARVLGATYGRLQSELLTPLVTRAAAILARRGEIPDLPLDHRTVALEYKSPQARYQAQQDVQNTLIWLDAVKALGPEALRAVDQPAAARWLGRTLGVPGELIREQDESPTRRRARRLACRCGRSADGRRDGAACRQRRISAVAVVASLRPSASIRECRRSSGWAWFERCRKTARVGPDEPNGGRRTGGRLRPLLCDGRRRARPRHLRRTHPRPLARPGARDAVLRHLEGQRQLVAQILALTRAGAKDADRAGCAAATGYTTGSRSQHGDRCMTENLLEATHRRGAAPGCGAPAAAASAGRCQPRPPASRTSSGTTRPARSGWMP